METQEVEVQEVVEPTENKIEIPESFREKYSENPDLAIEQLYKAQHKIVEQKKAKKIEQNTPNEWLSREQLEKFYEEKKFFETNPNMLEYKDQLNDFTSKGLSFEQAKKLVIDWNPDIVARQQAQQSNFTDWTPNLTKNTYSMSELANLWQKEYNKVMKLREQWKINIT